MTEEATQESAQGGLARGGAGADRGRRAAGRRARRPRVGGRPHRRRHPPAARGAGRAQRRARPGAPGRPLLPRRHPLLDGDRGARRAPASTRSSSARGSSAGTRPASSSIPRTATWPSRARPRPSSRHEKGLAPEGINTLIPVRFCYFHPCGRRSRSGQAAARQRPRRHAGEPGDLRERPRARHPDHRARVRRLRQRSRAVPLRRAGGEPVHRLPPQTGRLRPAPARRPDDPRQAPLRRRHPRADGCLRQRRREVRAAQQGPRHDPPEHPDPPRAAARHGAAAARDRRGRPLLPRGLRQHDPQRHRRPLGRRRRRRGLRPDALRRRLRPLLRPPPDDAADAAQDQDLLHRLRRGPGDQRHPRHRLPRPRAGRGQGLRDPGRRRHLDHGPRRADPLRVRRGRQRRLPQGRRGRRCASSTARSGCASTAPAPGSRSWSTRSASTPSASRSTPSSRATGSRSASSTPTGRAPALRRRRGGQRARRARRRRRRPTATAPSSSASSRATSRPSARRASRPSR